MSAISGLAESSPDNVGTLLEKSKAIQQLNPDAKAEMFTNAVPTFFSTPPSTS